MMLHLLHLLLRLLMHIRRASSGGIGTAPLVAEGRNQAELSAIPHVPVHLPVIVVAGLRTEAIDLCRLGVLTCILQAVQRVARGVPDVLPERADGFGDGVLHPEHHHAILLDAQRDSRAPGQGIECTRGQRTAVGHPDLALCALRSQIFQKFVGFGNRLAVPEDTDLVLGPLDVDPAATPLLEPLDESLGPLDCAGAHELGPKRRRNHAAWAAHHGHVLLDCGHGTRFACDLQLAAVAIEAEGHTVGILHFLEPLPATPAEGCEHRVVESQIHRHVPCFAVGPSPCPIPNHA
mmetsp:Transcript_41207/g.132698  ORF Transcript_41207/g.132698 Transcript_41207/m.132698 type:complete len:292 (+) Transcript_41207:974-1849(+)